MILTLTPNPSVDQTIALAGGLSRGQVQRADAVISQAGGKGVNISRASVSAGIPTVAIVPAAKDDPFVIELLAAGIDCRPVRPAGQVRVNVAITEPDGTTTKLNSPGATVGAQHLEDMADALVARAATSDWTVLAGSLPAGAPSTFYADVVRRLRGVARQVAVDTSEAPLRALVDALPESAPDLMKPNGDELASFTGGDPEELESDPAKAAEAARTLVDRGVRAVLATLGAHGAVLVTAEGAWHAAPPPTTVVSTVGAGDSSLFGYILGDIRGLPAPERLALAVAYGSAAASLPGTTIPEPGHLRTELVAVTALGGTS
ncbi:1-phosphofructokinase [Nocardioides gansuensis]|uniref:1-phosphofructokinase n=1 Tax=Nocardioides gansuensis TaxID=2138300 RepID=A0A2T8FAE8_9ACTN|nr:1-phosphofructokinase family hexose kinase [Nocardioides gansuensis]PVG82698.1 1-phosphofructokinase [Nocardioides gansuensis]